MARRLAWWLRRLLFGRAVADAIDLTAAVSAAQRAQFLAGRPAR